MSKANKLDRLPEESDNVYEALTKIASYRIRGEDLIAFFFLAAFAFCVWLTIVTCMEVSERKAAQMAAEVVEVSDG